MSEPVLVSKALDDWGQGVARQFLVPVAYGIADSDVPGHVQLILKTAKGGSELARYKAGEKVAEVLCLLVTDEIALSLGVALPKAVRRNSPEKKS